jgi:hypothetical protein
MHFRDGLSICEVSCRTGLSRNTVRQSLRHEGVIEPNCPERESHGVVGAWAEHLGAGMEANASRV